MSTEYDRITAAGYKLIKGQELSTAEALTLRLAIAGAASVPTIEVVSPDESDDYTLVDDDHGTIKQVPAGLDTPTTITVPADLPSGFYCSVLRDSFLPVTFVAGDGVTIEPAGTLSIAGQFQMATLFQIEADVYRLIGDISA